jgi:imidazole glycerol-phosphate synthase subunit HisH
MITIVDYGLGNIAAFVNVYRRLNIAASIAKSAVDLDGASRVILPGVGHFDHAMELLDRSGMRDTLDKLVLRDRVPVLGICVGMQMLARRSQEGKLSGLGWIGGDVVSFRSSKAGEHVALPHMGWNDVKAIACSKLFDEIGADARFYFLHSYHLQCDRQEDVLAICDYGADFSCAVKAGNIHGVQFHPEKSHHFGVRLLKNFAEL